MSDSLNDSVENKPKLVPELRFPEFEKDGEWEDKTLREVAERIEDKVNGKQLTTASISAGLGFVSQAEKFSRDISGDQYKNYIVLNEGEFSYNKGNSKRFPQGCIYKLKEFKQVAVPNSFISFRFKPNFISDFFQGYFDYNYHGRQLQQFITSGARMDGLLNIKAKDFFSIVLPTPSKAEQQKIAGCLSSLDELISANKKKLEALKAHKKGLMQNLFPQEGQSVPNFRFPEFENEEIWDKKRLDEIVNDFIVPMRDKPKKLDGEIPWCRIEDFEGMNLSDSKSNQGVSLETVKEMNLKVYPVNTLLVSCSADLGKCAITRRKLVTNQTFIGLVPDLTKVDTVYLYFVMSNSRNELNERSSGTTISYLSRREFEKFEVILPQKKEQQKIASCLTSLDELLIAEEGKIHQLQQHKKGLMQSLFP